MLNGKVKGVILKLEPICLSLAFEHVAVYTTKSMMCDLLLEFWEFCCCRERLTVETSTSAHTLTTRETIVKYAKLGKKDREGVT